MTDISIIGTGCLIVALVVAAGIVIWQRREIARLGLAADANGARANAAVRLYNRAFVEIRAYEAAEAKRHAQRIAAGKKGRATQTARALAKKVAAQ